jgi:hypothetical protein
MNMLQTGMFVSFGASLTFSRSDSANIIFMWIFPHCIREYNAETVTWQTLYGQLRMDSFVITGVSAT